MNKLFYKHYIFLDTINNVIENNITQFKKVNIIINTNSNEKKILENEFLIIKFAREKKIPFFFKNDYNKCIKYNSDGIFIDSANKKIIKPSLLKKKFKVIGLAHNQLEYSQKLRQKCNLLMLSPLFYNEKYSENKILNVLKFNNKKQNWQIDICALGGINLNTIKKIKLLNITSVGFRKFILEIKKNPLTI
jgi:thiamine-phosphate pyrophosphorylase